MQLEALISLSIITPVLAVLTTLLLQTLYQYYQSQAHHVKVYRSAQTQNSFEQAVLASDSLSFLPPARIHTDSVVTFTDGSANDIIFSKSHTKPSLRNDALTTANAIASNMLDVHSIENLGTKKLYNACASFLQKFQKDIDTSFLYNERSYLGISIEGRFELTGQAWIDSTQDNSICRVLELEHQKSMMFDAINPIAPIIKIIPLHSLYTLYKDQNETLRYLAHRGADNIENQPLEDSSDNIRISKTVENQIYTLLFQSKGQREKKILHIPLRVPRSSYLNALMIQQYTQS